MRRLASALLFVLIASVAFATGDVETTGAADDAVPTLDVWAVTAAEVPIDFETLGSWTEVEERTGVDLEWQIVSTAAKDQEFNLLMASGDLPDIIAYYEGRGGFGAVNRFGEEGAFVPLQDLIEEHAPTLESVLLEDELVREAITAQDGNIYIIPMMSAINAARGWYIRYDWLDELGLDVPTTTDELYDVLVAFRDQDPNGNGEADEVPLVFRRRGDDAFYNMMAFAYAFDADMEWVVRDGEVVYGPSEPQYQDYLAYIHKLYSEELIDQEVLTRSGNPRTELFSSDRGGAIHDWFASTAGLNDSLGGDIPGFNLRHMPPPVGTADSPYTRIQMSVVRNDGGWSITTSNEHPEATIKMMDFIYSEQGMLLTNFGVEGKTYTIQDGRPVYTAEITDNPDGLGMHEALVSHGMQWKIGMRQSIDYEAQFANEIAFQARQDYMDNYIVEAFPTLTFTPAENDVVTDLFSQIRAYVLENTAKFMVGARPVSEFDDFVAELEDIGLAEVTEIYQAAYDRKYN